MRKFWAKYEKNSNALQYRNHLSAEAVLLAAGRIGSLRTLCVAAQLIIEPAEEEPGAAQEPLAQLD